MKNLIIFGTGDIAQIAAAYFERDTYYKVIAFTVNEAFIGNSTFEGKPVVAFESLTTNFPPSTTELFIALSYQGMNKVRQEKYEQALAMGYDLASYVSPKCSFLTTKEIGKNCFIFEDNTIQPYVRIGNNVTLWSGNHIGHHSIIHDHNFISSHVVISGHCEIKSRCFLGVNSTIAHQVTIAEETLVGAGAIISKNTEPQGVYVAPRTIKLEKKSNEFKL